MAAWLLAGSMFSAQADVFQWLRTAGSSGAEVSRQIVVDDVGSSCIIGYFNSSNCAFDNIVLTNSLRAASLELLPIFACQ